MKFTIDIEDFWLEDEESLEQGLKDHITREVICQIKTSLKEQIETTIRQEVEQQFKENLSAEVTFLTREVVESGKVKRLSGSSNSDDKVLLKDWIINQVESNTGWSSPQKELEKYAKVHMDKIKKQYDFLYASSVVQKMADLGMLKDDKIAELLESK